MSETVSVIMPVYNGVPFLPKSLPPLVAMLRRGEVAEVVVVDDTSSDGHWFALIDKYRERALEASDAAEIRDIRVSLIKLAAVCVAFIESDDRAVARIERPADAQP